MLVIGLTGSIAMGKSTASRMLRTLGVPVHDADQSVHKLLGTGGGAVDEVGEAFPQSLDGTEINRKKLGALVFGDTQKLKRLESILHPKVHRLTQKFLRDQQRVGRKIVALDIPLLFETKGENRVDLVFVVSAPLQIQRQRVLARPGMTSERFNLIRNKQTPDRVKRRRADYLIPTGLGRSVTYKALKTALLKIKSENLNSRAFPNKSYRTRHKNFTRIF